MAPSVRGYSGAVVTPPRTEDGGPDVAPSPPSREQERTDRARMRTVAVIVVGLVVGVLTSFGQTHLVRALAPLANSASAWLVAPFVLGVLMRTRRGAAGAGLACALLQLGAYDGTSAIRDFPVSTSLIVFWAVCAAVGGPLFGLAGHIARRGRPAIRGLGGATLAAAFFAEGLWTYFHELHYDENGWLWVALGAVVCVALLRRLQRLRWLVLTVPVGLLAEIALTRIYT